MFPEILLFTQYDIQLTRTVEKWSVIPAPEMLGISNVRQRSMGLILNSDITRFVMNFIKIY